MEKSMEKFEPKVADVKRLTEETGRYMLACKQALAATKGDYEQARLWLTKGKPPETK